MRTNILRTAQCLFFAVCLIGSAGVETWGADANTATGTLALGNITTGNYNTADGFQALSLITTGSHNTAVGAYTLLSTTSSYNSAVGSYALNHNTTGSQNTAGGYQALYKNTTGKDNTADGAFALYSNTTGSYNTADGIGALQSNTTGGKNTAVGNAALGNNTTGYQNTAVGYCALYRNTTGLRNTALGYQAGYLGAGKYLTGNNNVYIGANVGPASQTESDTIRVGKTQTKAFVAGVYGSSVGSDGTEVYVNYYGRLGSVMSSRRYKEAIEDMGEASSGLMKLRPVVFRYKPEYADGPSAKQYGLIAEEVAEVYPDLVQYDPQTGRPETVHYRLVNAMLLNELQKQHKQLASLRERLKELSSANERLEGKVAELSALKEQVRQLTAMVERSMDSPGRLSRLGSRFDR